jgi:hypothetical protein
MIDKNSFKEQYDKFDKEVVVEIIDIFINEYKGRLKAIHDGIVLLDFHRIFSNGLAIKGILANFFDNNAHSLAWQLEHKGKDKDISGLMEDFEKLTHAVEGLVEELKEIRKQYV